MDKDRSALLPCPFCGPDAELDDWNGLGTQAEISCQECGCTQSIQVCDALTREQRFCNDTGFQWSDAKRSYREKAVSVARAELYRLWNTRPTPDSAGVEELREKLELIKQRCGVEMDYGSGSDAVQNGYILAGEALKILAHLPTPALREEKLVSICRELIAPYYGDPDAKTFEQFADEIVLALRDYDAALSPQETPTN